MSKGVPPPPLRTDAPKPGETYQHYKGDSYHIKLLALHSNDDDWMVVYEPLYENPDAPFFTRPLKDWSETVTWNGENVVRFRKIEG